MSDDSVSGTQLGDWLAELKPASEPPPAIPLLEPLPLNSEQRLAVQRGLTQPLTIVTGPPGTGKSQVVSSLLINAAFRGQRVLFASKNNKAIDVVETRVNALGPRPILLRLGTNEHRTRLVNYLSNLLTATTTPHDKAMFEEHNSVHSSISKAIADLTRHTEEFIAARNQLDRLEREVEDARKTLGARAFAASATFDVSEMQERLNQLRESRSRADQDRQGVLTRLLWPLHRKGRLARLSEVTERASSLFQSLGLTVPSHPTIERDVVSLEGLIEGAGQRLDHAKAARRYFDALAQIRGMTSLEELARQHDGLTRQLATNSQKLWDSWLRLQPSMLTAADRRMLGDYAALLELMVKAEEDEGQVGAELRAKHRQLYPSVIETLSCWAVTSLSARGRIPWDPGFFDVLIIDEASQCDIASALPLLFRARSAVIIGDPNQLKHISAIPAAQDRHLLVKHDLIENHARWAYSTSSLYDLASRSSEAGDIVVLRDHHRSHGDIITFSNKHFYEGNLRIATRYGRLNLPARDEPVVRWLSVSGDVQRPQSGGAVNHAEAAEVIRVLSELVLDKGYRGSVGVVSPFRAQANRINELVVQNPRLHEALMRQDFLADTVHSFQGDERDVIVFSPVVSRGITPIRPR